ncbi:TetR/AcrR family transcriptional regulator [Melittangium boletus]|uniref:TetR/AcrR family transcriptional regulator n=1 Tax=Melittangium boletus TaxID=83453 RepID=UPI003DA618A8
MTSPSVAEQRRYRGTPAEARRAQRREQLLQAAIEVYGEKGYRHATVKAVCEAAGLTERYFYESFANSEELLIAAFHTVADRLLEELARGVAEVPGGPLERTRALLTAYYGALRTQPRSARVFLVEISGVSPAVNQALVASLRTFGELLTRTMDPHGQGGASTQPLLRTGVVGGVLHIALRWISEGYTQPIHEVVEAALGLCRVLG